MKAHVAGLLSALVPSPDTASWPILDEDRPDRSSCEDITARILNRGRRSPLRLIKEIITAGIVPIRLHCELEHIYEIGTTPPEYDPDLPPLPDGCYLAVALLLLLSYVCDKWPNALFESPQATFNFKVPQHTLIIDGDEQALSFSLVSHNAAGESVWDAKPEAIAAMYLGAFLRDSGARGGDA